MSKMGPLRRKIGETDQKIPLVSPSLDQKESNCFGHPQFYSSIAPMYVATLTFNADTKGKRLSKTFIDRVNMSSFSKLNGLRIFLFLSHRL